MILPAREWLLVEREKILDYLLNLDHRYGASKARFFGAFGFRRDAWEVLRDALCEHGRRWEVKKDADQTAPRLITAYPSEES